MNIYILKGHFTLAVNVIFFFFKEKIMKIEYFIKKTYFIWWEINCSSIWFNNNKLEYYFNVFPICSVHSRIVNFISSGNTEEYGKALKIILENMASISFVRYCCIMFSTAKEANSLAVMLTWPRAFPDVFSIEPIIIVCSIISGRYNTEQCIWFRSLF